MHYLYGDSTPSPLKSNFLEFLRDAIDFCVVALKTDDHIADGRARAVRLKEAADAELERLEAFIDGVTGQIASAETGDPASPTAECSNELLALVASTHRSTEHAINQKLARDHANIDAEEDAAREPCVQALEALLVPHDPPDATDVMRLSQSEDRTRYHATLDARAAFGMAWSIDLAIGDNNPFASPVTAG